MPCDNFSLVMKIVCPLETVYDIFSLVKKIVRPVKLDKVDLQGEERFIFHHSTVHKSLHTHKIILFIIWQASLPGI